MPDNTCRRGCSRLDHHCEFNAHLHDEFEERYDRWARIGDQEGDREHRRVLAKYREHEYSDDLDNPRPVGIFGET